MFMHLDVNSEIYPLGVGQKFTMALATTLNLDGTPDSGYYTPVIFFVLINYCASILCFDGL